MKILITGPESTGKTTISKYIASQFKGHYIPEFAREYLEKNGPSYEEKDLLFFAKETLKSYQEKFQNNIQVFDTSLIDIVVWSLYKYDRCDPVIIQHTSQIHFDLIFLTTPKVAWKADPLRENENNRDELYKLFIKQMKKFNLAFTTLYAKRNQRENQVKRIIEEFLQHQ